MININVDGEYIFARCDVCGLGISAPNKGLGRVRVAVFKTQHQHIETTRDAR